MVVLPVLSLSVLILTDKFLNRASVSGISQLVLAYIHVSVLLIEVLNGLTALSKRVRRAVSTPRLKTPGKGASAQAGKTSGMQEAEGGGGEVSLAVTGMDKGQRSLVKDTNDDVDMVLLLRIWTMIGC